MIGRFHASDVDPIEVTVYDDHCRIVAVPLSQPALRFDAAMSLADARRLGEFLIAHCQDIPET